MQDPRAVILPSVEAPDNTTFAGKPLASIHSGDNEAAHTRKRTHSPPRGGKKMGNNDEIMKDILDALQEKIKELSSELGEKGLGTKRLSSAKSRKSAIDYTERNEVVPIDVRVEYRKVKDVDTKQQLFKADVVVQAKWEEPALVDLDDEDLEGFDGHGYWDPRLFVVNLMGAAISEENIYKVEKNVPGREFPVVVLQKRINGTFFERLELNDFPLDIQELTIQVSTRLSVNEVEFRVDPDNVSTVITEGFMDQDEWHIYRHVDSIIGQRSAPRRGQERFAPYVHFTCSVKRKPGFFFWNIIFIMILLITLMFTAFAIPPDQIAARLKVTLTLVLTCVAFKFTIKQSLPELPYLTYLDIYVISCFVLLLLQAIQNAVVSTLNYDKELMRNTDRITMYILIALYLVLHVGFFSVLITISYLRKKEMHTNESAFIKKKQDQQDLANKRYIVDQENPNINDATSSSTDAKLKFDSEKKPLDNPV